MKCGCTSQGELVKLEVMYMYAIGGGNLLHYCVQASIALASATVHKFQKYNFSFCFVLCIFHWYLPVPVPVAGWVVQEWYP